MQKRYQVFLSSTFHDLEAERLEVMRALLELDCFPCGMEYFPASNDDQWSFIKDLIDQCDYYVVVVAGRYGSVDAAGISFTQREYCYAVEKNIPVLGFVHEDPAQIPQGKSELNPEGQKRLIEFRALVQTRLCKQWSNAADLGAVVSRSLTQLMRRSPRPGWIRSDHLASLEAAEEIIRLRLLNDQLSKELSALSELHRSELTDLAQGDDPVELAFTVTLTDRAFGYPYQYHRFAKSVPLTWKEILVVCGPYLLSESKLSSLKSALNRMVKDRIYEDVANAHPGLDFNAVAIHESSLQLVIVQLTALGYISITTVRGEGAKELRIAALTPLGRTALMTASAVKRGIKAVATADMV